MAQGVDPEFKPQHYKKRKKECLHILKILRPSADQTHL
jgi:hypothetical protein